MAVANLQPDMVVGHWGANDEFVPVELEYARGPTRPGLKFKWWAQIPETPTGLALRSLDKGDFKVDGIV
jgi:hypothetical protein